MMTRVVATVTKEVKMVKVYAPYEYYGMSGSDPYVKYYEGEYESDEQVAEIVKDATEKIEKSDRIIKELKTNIYWKVIEKEENITM